MSSSSQFSGQRRAHRPEEQTSVTTTTATTTEDKFEAIKQCASALFEQRTRNLAQTADMQAAHQALLEREKELKQRHHMLQDLAAQFDSDIQVCTQRNSERKLALAELDAAIQSVHANYGQLQVGIQHAENVASAVDSFVADVFHENGVVATFLQTPAKMFANLSTTDLRGISADVRKVTSACCSFVQDVRSAVSAPSDASPHDARSSSLIINQRSATLSALSQQLTATVDGWLHRNSPVPEQRSGSIVNLLDGNPNILHALSTLRDAISSSSQSDATAATIVQDVQELLVLMKSPDFANDAWHIATDSRIRAVDSFCREMCAGAMGSIVKSAQEGRLLPADSVAPDNNSRVTLLLDAFQRTIGSAETPTDQAVRVSEDGVVPVPAALTEVSRRLISITEASSVLTPLRREVEASSDAANNAEAREAAAALALQGAKEEHQDIQQALTASKHALNEAAQHFQDAKQQQCNLQSIAEDLQAQLIACASSQDETVTRAISALECLWAADNELDDNQCGLENIWETARKLDWDSSLLQADEQELNVKLLAVDASIHSAKDSLIRVTTAAASFSANVDFLVGHMNAAAEGGCVDADAFQPYQGSATLHAPVDEQCDAVAVNGRLDSAISQLQQLHTSPAHKFGTASVHRLTSEVKNLKATSCDLGNEKRRLEELLVGLTNNI